MDPQFQRSFIPKKPIMATTSRVPKSINLFVLIAVVLFIVSLALSGAAFFYKNLVTKQIETNKASLDRAKDAFEPDLIQQIIRRDTRLEISKQLLSSHVAITPLFDYLSTITLKSVRFRDFNFSYLAPDKVQVTMRGQAQSYAAVALEADLLNSQKNLHDTILSDMTLEPAGTVSFSVSTIIDPNLLTYSAAINRGGVQSQPTTLSNPPETTQTAPVTQTTQTNPSATSTRGETNQPASASSTPRQ